MLASDRLDEALLVAPQVHRHGWALEEMAATFPLHTPALMAWGWAALRSCPASKLGGHDAEARPGVVPVLGGERHEAFLPHHHRLLAVARQVDELSLIHI